MITGIWKNVVLVCGNPDHEEEQPMIVREMSLEEEKSREKKHYEMGEPDKAFYCCPKYNPDARKGDEHACFNRISVAEMEKALNIVCDKIETDEEENGAAFIKNYKFETKNAMYKVLETKGDFDYIKLMVILKSALDKEKREQVYKKKAPVKSGLQKAIEDREASAGEPKKKRGRPKKNVAAPVEETIAKKKRGRPKKSLLSLPNEEIVVKRKRERPKKNLLSIPVEESVIKKKRGRPKKLLLVINIEEAPVKKKRGRPKKNPQT